MFAPEPYAITAILFIRLLGLIYFFAFGAFLFQIKGLIGSAGILPSHEFLTLVKEKLPNKCYRLLPSLFWLGSSDKALIAVTACGTAISIALMLGIYPTLCLLLLYILYISIVTAGQDFLSFGWEGFLLEITINAFFLSISSPPNLLIWISLNLVLFRFHLQAGAVKIQSGDPNWRNLTAVAYHYQSQPIPNMIAWYAHKLPMWFHKSSTALMFVIELIVPFAMFGTDSMRLMAFFAFVGLQWAIWITGNFSYLNHLTVVLCTILVADHYLPSFITSWIGEAMASRPPEALSLLSELALDLIGLVLVVLHGVQLWNHFVPNPLFSFWLNKISPFHLSNRYGIFAVMTTTRHEIIFEGSDDGVNWQEYTFYHKPSQLTKRPKRISPYQPRLDWQAWFLPFGRYQYDAWVGNFIYRLLLGSPDVLKLLEHNPFKEKPPKYIRSLKYEYTFTSFEEKARTHNWWNREFIGVFTQPMHLRGQ